MKTHTSTRSKPMASGLSAVIAICAGAAMLVNVNSAFAQIDPNLKTGVAGNAYRNAVTTVGEHNPPDDKCGHNPLDDKTGKTAETRALVPAVKAAGLAKKADTQKANAPACANK